MEATTLKSLSRLSHVGVCRSDFRVHQSIIADTKVPPTRFRGTGEVFYQPLHIHSDTGPACE